MIKQRSKNVDGNPKPSLTVASGQTTNDRAKLTRSSSLKAAFESVLNVFLFVMVLMTIYPYVKVTLHQGIDMFSETLKPIFKQAHSSHLHGMIGEDVRVSFHWNKTEGVNGSLSLGPHESRVTILTPDCSHPRIALRLKGDALVYIPLQQSDSTWAAFFSLPVAGTYEVDARWYGCDNSNTKAPIPFASLSQPIVLTAGQSSKTGHSSGFWLQKRHLNTDTFIFPEYVWMYPNMSSVRLYNTISDKGTSTVSMSDNQVSSMDDLSGLSNYEVVCFVGTESASVIHDNFLSLRPQISPNQRPFKFHYYPMKDLHNPEVAMSEKRLISKCKQTFVVLDELDISQQEFKPLIIRFLKEMNACMFDDTWSIWMLTVSSDHPQTCHSSLHRTAHHPCNDVLFELFDSKELPSNIRLMDNTDVSNVYMGENVQDVASVIAMRVAHLMGKQVKTWRDAGQIGERYGLERNGVNIKVPVDECHFTGS